MFVKIDVSRQGKFSLKCGKFKINDPIQKSNQSERAINADDKSWNAKLDGPKLGLPMNIYKKNSKTFEAY